MTTKVKVDFSPGNEQFVEEHFNFLFPLRKIRKFLFVNPPDGPSELFRFLTAKRGRYANYPPYGPLVLAENLRQIGVEVEILNLNHEILRAYSKVENENDFNYDEFWQRVLDEKIKEFSPDIVGVTCMFTMTHVSFKRVCQHAKKSGRPIAVGGVHVTNDVVRVCEDIPEIDLAFLYESDVSIKTFCEVVEKQRPISDLSQLLLNTESQYLQFTALTRPDAKALDVIPAYDLIGISELSSFGTIGNFHGFKDKGTRFATALSNRGCRARCSFCSVRNFNGLSVRQRSVDSVLDELQLLNEKYGVGHIVWLDDDLLNNHERAISLFNGIVKRKINITWDATNGVIAHSCNEEMVQAMAESGCVGLNIGMESGNPEILKQVKKPGLVSTFIRAAEIFRKYPTIHARAFLMLGFPGETLRMINDTINVAKKMDLDWYGITVLQPLPNTPIYDSMVAQGLVQKVGSTDVRFNSGGFGKQNEVDRGERLAAMDFETAFCSMKMDEIPTNEQLQDIWFYMNYHLNFHRLFSETRPMKIEQQFRNLRALCDVISPEHGFALYFLGYLQFKHQGFIEPEVISRLEQQLSGSSFWNERFKAFGLHIDDLKQGNFKNREIMRLLPGEIPVDNRRIEELVRG